MVRTTSIEIHPAKHKTLQIKSIVDLNGNEVSYRQMEQEAEDLAELFKGFSPEFAKVFLEKYLQVVEGIQ